jgi:hypothetical protein
VLVFVEPTTGDPQQPDDETDLYAVTVCTKESVRRFSPSLPPGGCFVRGPVLRDVLLAKRTMRRVARAGRAERLTGAGDECSSHQWRERVRERARV